MMDGHVSPGPSRSLRVDASGIAAVEFALVAPAFFLLMLGTMDLGHTLYARSVLSGAVESAARSSALETADTDAADQMVEDTVSPVMPGVQLTTTRLSYFDFSDIGRPERWTDNNGNDTCDDGEVFVDENRSGEWEEDIGTEGNGSANDVVVYRVEARFNPVFAVPFLPRLWRERTAVATAVRKNQPFAMQRDYSSSTGTCTGT